MHFTRDSAPPGDCREGHWDEQKNVSFIAKGTPISVTHPTRRVWLCRKCAPRPQPGGNCVESVCVPPLVDAWPAKRRWPLSVLQCRKYPTLTLDRQSGDDHCPCFSVASTRRWRLTGKAEMTTVRASVSQVPDVDAWPAKRRWPLSVLQCRKYPTLTLDRRSGDDHCPCFSVASTRRWRLTGEAEMTTVRASVSQVPDVDAWPAKRRWPLSVLQCRKYPTLTLDRRSGDDHCPCFRVASTRRWRVTGENCQNDAATIDYMTENISNIFAVAGPLPWSWLLKEGFTNTQTRSYQFYYPMTGGASRPS